MHLFGFVQVKQGVIQSSVHRTSSTPKGSELQKHKNNIHLEFEPLVRVDPSVIAVNREPLQNPRVGDYLLKQTASTEGIASKKSLELKKRYLLGDAGLSTGIMKSDSMSMLDSKFRNFHSTITGCQKMLNPTAVEKIPIAEAVNKNTINAENMNKQLALNQSKVQDRSKQNDEKENVYDQIVSTRNELNKNESVPETSKPAKSGGGGENGENPQHILIENKIREPIAKAIDANMPESPKKATSATNSNSTSQAHDNKRNSFEYSDKFKNGSSSQHVIDRSLENKFEDYTPVYDNRKEGDSMFFATGPKLPQEKGRTSIEVAANVQVDDGKEQMQSIPSIVWAKTTNQKRPDSDTFSSSTSSPADIPHFILESTTSPDTQTTPSDPCENRGDDLMQMDSLMLIDGKYVGDPEDLKHIQMPESFNANVNKTIIHVQSAESVEVKNEPAPVKQESIKTEQKPFKYEPIYKRPAFRFDTKNENKIDTLKNIPLIMPSESEKPVKPNLLSLTNTVTNADESSDNDKTPTVANPGKLLAETGHNRSDSETEMTGPVLTETELSDWTADDAVSENFVDMEFAMNSNKGTIRRNKKSKKKSDSSHSDKHLKQAPIARNLDFDELEFMDTGSEDSYVETFAATNKAMLNNRGYVQFVNTHPDMPSSFYDYKVPHSNVKPTRIDLSENTARSKDQIRGINFIEQGALILGYENDLKTPMNESPAAVSPRLQRDQQHDSQQEIEEDSLVFIPSQGGNTTTEESEALTVVTSPMESVPRYDESSSSNVNSGKNHSVLSNTSSNTPKKHTPSHTHDSNTSINRKNSDEITYEDYVRQLQMKITQISNARDSIDIRKTKRKHSKNDMSIEDHLVQTQQPQQQQQKPPSPSSVIDNNKSLSIYVGQANEAPVTVGEKLEEISKERMKQKDLIHDLVIEKLQSKKQSNAEKRLNRSRNRSSALSISPSTTILPPPVDAPKPPPSQIVHSQSASSIKYLPNQSKVLSLSPTKELLLINQNHKPSQRPRSANVEEYPVFETPKISKTQSFCVHGNRDGSMSTSSKNMGNAYQYQYNDNSNIFSTPIIPRRRKLDDELAQTTEKLRQDARHRARLKSNQDLGLSPEEKIALLRKRYNLENSITTATAVPCSTYTPATPNKSDDMKVRERKMITSKSVNDISANNLTLSECTPIGNNNHRKLNDFTSNPNLAEEKTSPKRRQKDPERRKSIIQAVSDFFHKKRDKDSPSSPKEKSEGMFGRLRISPKSKSKVHQSSPNL